MQAIFVFEYLCRRFSIYVVHEVHIRPDDPRTVCMVSMTVAKYSHAFSLEEKNVNMTRIAYVTGQILE